MSPRPPSRLRLSSIGPSMGRPRWIGLTLWLGLTCAACAPRRILLVESHPPGATVRLDDEVIGETPLRHEFQHYGTRRVTLYKHGFRTWSQRVVLKTPWHSRFPIDIVTEILLPIGLEDEQSVWVILEEDIAVSSKPDLDPLLERAAEMRDRGTRMTPQPEADPGSATGEPTAQDPSNAAGNTP